MSPGLSSPSDPGEIDPPFLRRVLNRRSGLLNRSRYLRYPGLGAELVQLFRQRPDRLLLEDRDNRLDAARTRRVQIDDISAGRAGHASERLEIGPHVLEDRLDDIAQGAAPRPED